MIMTMIVLRHEHVNDSVMKGMLNDALEETAWTILLQELHAQRRMIYQGKINMNHVLYYKQDEHGHY